MTERTVPRATYRLQLRPGFGFDEAARLVDYLAELGVSHVYFSPYLQAGPGSAHGYDVVDHSRVNDELGGAEAHTRMVAALREQGLGHVVDVVPNHMSIATRQNRWWWDVLENGPSSRYARYFDVDWNPREEWLKDRILMPILGDHYGRVLDEGEVRVEREGSDFTIGFYEHVLPVAPTSLAGPLAAAAERCGSEDLGFLAHAIAGLPSPALTDADVLVRRHRDKAVIGRLLARLLTEEPDAARALDAVLAELQADPNKLHPFLELQNYRLAYWRAARHDLDYRRFFDINTLVALRMDREEVFLETHRLLLGWVQEGHVDGLRVDHPDGLRDPQAYFWRLRQAAPKAWIVAEKILEGEEELPEAWPIGGTTGYDFLHRLTALFVDPAGERPLTDLYAEVLDGERLDFHALARERKRRVLRDLLWSDLNRLAGLLVQVSERHRRYRDFTREQFRQALEEVVACLPVYRTYVRKGEKAGLHDAAHIQRALELAQEDRPTLDDQLLAFLSELLTGKLEGDAETEFTERFQQLTGPAMAKGVEDTAFYCYHRLVSLNEVGGDPTRFGLSLDELHAWCQRTQERWPETMLTTSTHDTKRSEDTRARISLLAEDATRWRETALRWREHVARHRPEGWADPNAEYLLFQTLVGAWPLSVDRVRTFMEKAAREAKEHTSWTQQDPDYEEGLRALVTGLLGDRDFTADVEAYVGSLDEPARAVSLAQTLIKLTAPGVPDLYQGNELWRHDLVDPDNRRPVDFARRRRLLGELDGPGLDEVLARADEGLPKLWVIRQALRLRRQHPAWFAPVTGTYAPLRAEGPQAHRVIAFVRGGAAATVTSRFPLGLRESGWGDTRLELPEGTWTCELSGQRHAGGRVPVEALLGRFPAALLVREEVRA